MKLFKVSYAEFKNDLFFELNLNDNLCCAGYLYKNYHRFHVGGHKHSWSKDNGDLVYL